MIDVKVIKKINNNFAIAIDDSGSTIVVNGIGIGFQSIPYEITDLSKIKRTYYCVEPRIAELLVNLDETVIEAATQSVMYAEKKLEQKLNPNLPFSLADHIEFAMKRIQNGQTFQYGITIEMKYLHSREMDIATSIIEYLQKIFDIKFPEEEITAIAMHILEAEDFSNKRREIYDNDKLFHDISILVEKGLGINLDTSSFNYYRFITHIQFLIDRKREHKEIASENSEMFHMMQSKYPQTYDIALSIKVFFENQFHFVIGDEEVLYLMIHINRLKDRD